MNPWSINGSKLTVMQNVVISVKTNIKKVLYLTFENSVMFQYFIKGIIITLYTVIVLTTSQLLTCNSINLCNNNPNSANNFVLNQHFIDIFSPNRSNCGFHR